MGNAVNTYQEGSTVYLPAVWCRRKGPTQRWMLEGIFTDEEEASEAVEQVKALGYEVKKVRVQLNVPKSD